jgi:hypothetical protein
VNVLMQCMYVEVERSVDLAGVRQNWTHKGAGDLHVRFEARRGSFASLIKLSSICVWRMETGMEVQVAVWPATPGTLRCTTQTHCKHVRLARIIHVYGILGRDVTNVLSYMVYLYGSGQPYK